MIEFDNNGNPKPLGLTDLELDDFKSVFVEKFNGSETREEIFDSYSEYITDFQNEIVKDFKNWINGSFTTTKKNPNDIDIVNLVDHSEDLNSKTESLVKFLTQGGSKDNYLVDSYFVPIYPKDDPRYAQTEHWINYWQTWFGKDRQGREKGIIQLSFS